MIKNQDDRNGLERLFQEGCARIRLPKTRKSDPVEAVMINTSGGLTDGDELIWKIASLENASTVITTQACERIYKAKGSDPAHFNANLKLENSAHMAWLPQETILFNQAKLHRRISVELTSQSEFLMVEPLIFGRAAMGEEVKTVNFNDQWRVYQEGVLIHAENQKIDGNASEILQKNAVTKGDIAAATILYVGSKAEARLNQVRDILPERNAASCWQIGDGSHKLVVRLTAPSAYDLRKKLIPLIELLNDGHGLPRTWLS